MLSKRPVCRQAEIAEITRRHTEIQGDTLDKLSAINFTSLQLNTSQLYNKPLYAKHSYDSAALREQKQKLKNILPTNIYPLFDH